MSTLLEQASLVMIPSGYKEDIVYSPVPTNGNGDLSFTRASNGTRVNSQGLVEVVPWNLVQYSEDFSNGVWATYGTGTITTNTTTAPNGTTTADKFTPNTTNTTHACEQNMGTTSGAIIMSLYAKADGYNWLCFNSYVGGFKLTWFNISTGTIGTVASGVSASIESVGNGWYRCIVSLTGGASTYFSIIPTNANNVSSFAGDGTSGIFIWGAQVNIGSTAKPYFPTTDRLNVPRLTYQNGGGGCPSLLLEKQSTNLLKYSEQFDNAVHYKLDVTITANNITSPDGTQNADKFTETTGTGEHIVYDIDSIATGTYTLSAFFKGGAGTIYPVLRLNGSSTTAYAGCIFNTSTGAVVNTFYNTYSAPITKVENLGNGWYRVSMTTTTTDANFGMRIAASNSTSPSVGAYGAISYTGSTSNYFYVWGAQLEASSYATSYIPTTSSSATRVADACYKTGISSLIGQTEGTMFVHTQFSQYVGSGNDVWLMECVNDDTSNGILIYAVNNTSINVYINNGSTTVNLVGTGDIRQPLKVAVAYKSGDFALYINGTQADTDTNSFTFPSNINQMGLGKWVGLPTERPIQYNQAILFPTRLTNSELAQLTA